MMLAADGRMMLGDFGWLTLRDKQAAHNAACVGTPGYLAPDCSRLGPHVREPVKRCTG